MMAEKEGKRLGGPNADPFQQQKPAPIQEVDPEMIKAERAASRKLLDDQFKGQMTSQFSTKYRFQADEEIKSEAQETIECPNC